MKDLVNIVKWWWQKKCLHCGGTLQTQAFVSCKGETWVMIHRTEIVCTDCGKVKKEV